MGKVLVVSRPIQGSQLHALIVRFLLQTEAELSRLQEGDPIRAQSTPSDGCSRSKLLTMKEAQVL